MKVEFKSKQLEILYLGIHIGKQKFPYEVIKQYKKKVEILLAVDNIFELRLYRGLNFEALKGDRKGEYSIRINDQYRLIFEQIETIQHRVIIKVLFINEISKHYE